MNVISLFPTFEGKRSGERAEKLGQNYAGEENIIGR